MQATKLTFDDIKSVMDKNYTLYYADYRSNLDGCPDIVEKCIEERSLDPAYEHLCDHKPDEDTSHIFEEIQDDIERRFDLEEGEANEIMAEFEEEIREEIWERDDSTWETDVIKNTDDVPIMVSMYSNYDCINSHWLESSSPGYSYTESYFGQVVDVLQLNPAEVKKAFVKHGINVCGRWPNKPKRNPLVKMDEFIEETENRGCGACLLVFVGKIDLSSMPHEFKIVTFEKGNACGFFSSFQGGGSLIEMELQRDFTINLDKTHHGSSYDSWGIETANNGSYSIKSAYGVCNSFFGDAVKLA